MSGESGSLAFFERLFDETTALLYEARDDAALRLRAHARANPAVQLIVSCESLRVTARLTQVMAWLLVRKAVLAGELVLQDARAPHHRLSGREVCLAERPDGAIGLPRRLQRLLDRSRELYLRVARLDALKDGRGPERRPTTAAARRWRERRLKEKERTGKRPQ